MLHFDWLKAHKKEIRILLVITLILAVCLFVSGMRRDRFLIKENHAIVAVERESLEQTLSLPLEVEVEKDGEKLRYEVILYLQGPARETGETEPEGDEGTERKDLLLEDAIAAVVEQLKTTEETRVALPKKLEDGTKLRWKEQKDLRFLLLFLLLPASLLYIYETERQREKERRKRWEEEIRRNLPSFLDQMLLLLNCGIIFHDAFYRIEAGYAARGRKDAFCDLLSRIKREADESGFMVITVMKSLAQEVSVREYVRMVNLLIDHQHRGVDLEDKLQAESRLLWEGRKAAAMQKGKEMETKMTFPLALLLMVLIIVTGMPALMNM